MTTDSEVVGRGPLWARPGETDRDTLPWWKALALALLLELGLPFALYGVDWSFWPQSEPLPPMKITAVDVREPPPPEPPPPPPPEKRKKLERKPPPLPVEPPKAVPGAKPSKIELPEKPPEPEPEPPKKPEPEPEPEPEPTPEPPPPEPEPEAPELPSVFQDAKPVRKVRIKYPPEAEAKHIQGRVKVRLSVSAEGKVTDVQILEAEPQGVFDEAVLEAMRQYVFKRDGTTYQADQEVIFKIDE